jgi:DNA-binding response OmpR family regulator
MTKILVIEDENGLREEIIEWLTIEGYEVFGAQDGIDGVSEALSCQPDLIVCDVTMPRLDGYGVLLELRANPNTAAIPFVFLTARATQDDVRRGMDQGADDYITKPFTLREFLQTIQNRLWKKAVKE